MSSTDHRHRFDAAGRLQAPAAPLVRGRRFDRTLFAEDLAELLGAGLSVREALEVVEHGMPAPRDRLRLRGLQARITAGASVSAAMAPDAQAYGPLLVALVQASEQTSDLAGALQRYAQAARRMEALGARIVSALVYPALLLAVALLVMVFLLGWVLPRFAEVVQDSGALLSPLARGVIDLGAWFGRARALLLVLGGAGLVGLLGLAASAHGRAWLQAQAARVPGLDVSLRLLHASRFFASAATLTQGGLTAVAAFELSAPMLLPQGRRHVYQAVQRMRAGQPLARSLDGDVFGDPVVGRLLEVGQRTGALPATLLRITTLLEARTARRLDRVAKAFEPLLMALIGVMVGAVVLMMYVPLLEMTTALQGP